jgi:glycosyltransferase involved in cell wall biosynthesis
VRNIRFSIELLLNKSDAVGAHDGPTTLHVVTDTDRRGAQIFSHELGLELAGRGASVRSVALTAGRHGGLPFDTLGPSRLHPRTLRALRAEMRRSAVTIGFGSSTLPACTLTGHRPFVYRSIGEIGRWATSRTQRIWVRAFLRRATGVIALWNGAADDLSRAFGVDRSKIHVIPRGVSAAAFPPADDEERAAAKAALGLTGMPVVLAVGALAPEKRLDLAIEAVAAVPDGHLVLAGSGPLEATLRAAGERLAPGRVHLLGQVADVVPLLHAADTLVLTSATEGMPGVVIEAGLAGVPTVSTDVGAVSEMIVTGETGAVVPRDPSAPTVSAALVEVLEDATRLGTGAREHCTEHYELSSVAVRWLEMIEHVRTSRR